MRITEYRLELDENRHSILVKEKAFNYPVEKYDCPVKLVDMLNNVFNLNHLAEEYAYMIALHKGKIVGIFQVSHGITKECYMNSREIFIRAVLVGATHIILCHNHPGESSTPTQEDIWVTKRIKECGELMGIPLLDHIIIAGDTYTSIFEDYDILKR